MDSSASTPPVKPARKPPSRSIGIVELPAPDSDGWSAIRIMVGQETTVYLLRAVPADFGEGFQLEKLDEGLQTVETYDVNLMGQESTWTCPGHTFHGHCRHVSGLQALDAKGKLRRLKQKHHACPWCLERCDGGQLCERCAAEEEAFTAYHEMCEREAGGCSEGPATEARSA
jgi:hypothetical protein